jgi:hypothetical protein
MPGDSANDRSLSSIAGELGVEDAFEVKKKIPI